MSSRSGCSAFLACVVLLAALQLLLHCHYCCMSAAAAFPVLCCTDDNTQAMSAKAFVTGLMLNTCPPPRSQLYTFHTYFSLFGVPQQVALCKSDLSADAAVSNSH